MENCQVLCNYKNTKILIQEPPKFLLKPPPPLPQFEFLKLNSTSFLVLNKKCEFYNKTTTKLLTINDTANTQSINNDYNLFIILLYSCLILISMLIIFAIVYLVLTR
jgi:hypothetical protein